MKKLILLITISLLCSCANKKDDPLIVPPNFAEMPDLNNIEKPDVTQQSVDVEKLKELLLKSEE